MASRQPPPKPGGLTPGGDWSIGMNRSSANALTDAALAQFIGERLQDYYKRTSWTTIRISADSGRTFRRTSFAGHPPSTGTATTTGRIETASANCTTTGERPIIGACEPTCLRAVNAMAPISPRLVKG
jgi:hypothetical protein